MTPGRQVSVVEPLRPAAAALQRMDPLLLLLRASLMVLLINSNDDVPLLVAVAATCVVALPRPGVLRSPWFWGGAFTIVGLRQLTSWHTLDDHVIATTYWCGALALGLTSSGPERTLAASARFLVGSLFAFAAGWKLLSGEFVDGTFFRYSLLIDDRFEVVARLAGGTTDPMRASNVAEAVGLVTGSADVAPLQEGPRNASVATAFTWWGAVTETAIALTFLAPIPRAAAWVRHAWLVAFAATTYAIVPVGGFGVLLLVLGAAMVTTDRARTAYYVGALALALWAGLWPLILD